MKKILLTMIGLCLILGMQAQTTKRLREYRNPQIDGLMKYAKSMGVDVWEFYSRNYRGCMGILFQKLSIHEFPCL